MKAPGFIKGKEYKRSEIHDQFGGSRQSGICPSAKLPFIFIFSSKSGSKYGYKDGWLNDEKSAFSYTGAGPVGNMVFKLGNLALANHIVNGKRVFLFEGSKKRSHVIFSCELWLEETDLIQAKDLNGELREAIVFRFRASEVLKYSIPLETRSLAKEPRAKGYSKPRTMDPTEKEVWSKHRVGQGVFRQNLLVRWKGKCVVTNCEDPRLLTASHIVPWKNSNDIERLDVENGLLLSPIYDRLFDRHLISFTESGQIILSDWVAMRNYKALGVSGKEKISGLNERNIQYLSRHRALLH